MPKTSDIDLGGRFMGLLVGTNGSGKTVAGASFPGPGLVLDFDGRTNPIRFFYPKRTDIEYWTIGLDGESLRSDTIGFSAGLDMIENLQDRCPYDWVMMDSYTMYSAVSVYHQMGVRLEDIRRRKKLGQSIAFKDIEKAVKTTKGGLPIPDWDEYKGETGVMLQIMEIFKVLPCHIIVTAHPISAAKVTKQGGSTNETLASMVKGQSIASYGWKTPSFLPNYFNEMYHFDVQPPTMIGHPPRRIVQTVSAGEVVAKTALPLPETFEITNLPMFNVMKKLLGDEGIDFK
jgi:hypothetical protein